MNNIHFRLRAQGKSIPVIVLWVYDSRFKGRQFKYSTGEVISPDLWLKKKERAKIIPSKEKELNTLNDHLDRLNQAVIDFMGTKHNSKTIVREDLKKYLDALRIDEEKELQLKQKQELELEKQNLEKENDFYSTWERNYQNDKKQRRASPHRRN